MSSTWVLYPCNLSNLSLRATTVQPDYLSVLVPWSGVGWRTCKNFPLLPKAITRLLPLLPSFRPSFRPAASCTALCDTCCTTAGYIALLAPPRVPFLSFHPLSFFSERRRTNSAKQSSRLRPCHNCKARLRRRRRRRDTRGPRFSFSSSRSVGIDWPR